METKKLDQIDVECDIHFSFKVNLKRLKELGVLNEYLKRRGITRYDNFTDEQLKEEYDYLYISQGRHLGLIKPHKDDELLRKARRAIKRLTLCMRNHPDSTAEGSVVKEFISDAHETLKEIDKYLDD